MSESTPTPGSTAAWVMASRPATLAAAIIPVAVGAACVMALDGLRWWPTLAALLGAVWIQIGTNFANDVFDYEKGADSEERLGPTRAVQAGLLAPGQARRGMWLAFALATLCGAYLVWVAGWPIVVIGVASIVSGIAYTGGPYPLGYHGLGDVFVFAFFGFVAVCGTAFVNLLSVPTIAWWAAVPVGCLSTAILVVNNVRDRVGDREAGKGTLVARFGRRVGDWEYRLLIVGAYLVPVWLYAAGQADVWVLLPWLSLPIAIKLVRDLGRLEGRPLNATLVGTARLLVVFGALFAVGLALSRVAG